MHKWSCVDKLTSGEITWRKNARTHTHTHTWFICPFLQTDVQGSSSYLTFMLTHACITHLYTSSENSCGPSHSRLKLTFTLHTHIFAQSKCTGFKCIPHTVSTCLRWPAAFHFEGLTAPLFIHAHTPLNISNWDFWVVHLVYEDPSGPESPPWCIWYLTLFSFFVCVCIQYALGWVYVSVCANSFVASEIYCCSGPGCWAPPGG